MKKVSSHHAFHTSNLTQEFDDFKTQNIVGEEEALITRIQLPPSYVNHCSFPISIELLDILAYLGEKGSKSSYSLLRQKVSSLIQQINPPILDNMSLDLSNYDFDASNKIVNWFGIVLKVHQVILQTGLYQLCKRFLEPSEEDPSKTSKSQEKEEGLKPEVKTDRKPSLKKEVQANITGTDWLRLILFWGSPNFEWKLTPSSSNEMSTNSFEFFLQQQQEVSQGHYQNPSHPASPNPARKTSLPSSRSASEFPDPSSFEGRSQISPATSLSEQPSADGTGATTSKPNSRPSTPALIKSSSSDTDGPQSTEAGEPGIYLPLELLLLCLNAHGYLDHYCQALVLRAFQTSVEHYTQTHPGSAPFILPVCEEYLFKGTAAQTCKKKVERLNAIYNKGLKHRITAEKYDKYLNNFTSKSAALVTETLNGIEEDLIHLLRAQDRRSVKQLERLLISLMGDHNDTVREQATRLLNVLYSGNHWEIPEPLTPTIAFVGDPFQLEVKIPTGSTIDPSLEIYLLIRCPPVLSSKDRSILTRFRPTLKVNPDGSQSLVENLRTFHRPGFFDWRFVVIGEDGATEPISKFITGLPLSAVQGRYIVHPKIQQEQMCEILMSVYGSFSRVAAEIPKLKKRGITMIYLCGVFERADTADPYISTDRCTPKRTYGGATEFRNLTEQCKEAGIKIIIDVAVRIAADGPHRKYTGFICHHLDKRLRPKRQFDVDGKSKIWEDSFLLNYRKLEVWELLVEEITILARQYPISGVRIANAHLLPLLLEKDLTELKRQDSDGNYHYTPQQIMDGEIIIKGTGGHAPSVSYWETSRKYANPLLVKLAREVWSKYTSFYLIGEADWNRESCLASSGIIPVDPRPHKSLEEVLSRDGDVQAIYEYYEFQKPYYPRGSISVHQSTTHASPLPIMLFGRGAWAAVDYLYFLPEVPMIYKGEEEGWAEHRDMTVKLTRPLSVSAPSIPVSAPISRYVSMPEILGHYEHRANLRTKYDILKYGKMFLLRCFHRFGKHPKVLAFGRAYGDEVAIIAINLNKYESTFYIDRSPLAEYFKDDKVTYVAKDMINITFDPHHFSHTDLIEDQQYLALPPFAALFWSVSIKKDEEAVPSENLMMKDSLKRLLKHISSNEDCANNYIYKLCKGSLSTVEGFGKFITALCDKVLPIWDKKEGDFPSELLKVVQMMATTANFTAGQALAYLVFYAKNGNAVVQDTTKKMLKANRIGPIVFVAPELGKWSTVGGLGVMVDELTQDLASLGAEVHVISPYYNRNRKGEGGYLARDNILWTHNIRTWIGDEFVEVGVHEGEFNGVKVVFLHHPTYFPHPYPTGAAAYMLKVIVLMAKASLECCCSSRTLPAVMVTNDWFAGLVPAYAKSGAFGSAFAGTSFLHIVHNLEEGYQGLIYSDNLDALGKIHQLRTDWLLDPFAPQALNPSRTAFMTSDNWATVSKSYCADLLHSSSLAALLRTFHHPFAYSNGIRKRARLEMMRKIAPSHAEAKAILQQKYFGYTDPSKPVLSFVGRITSQKGVHLILEAVPELVDKYQGNIQIIVGGPANYNDPYSVQCAGNMIDLRRRYPANFWADPDNFFTDGSLVNLGSDFGVMPSLFEPGGVVQHEFFVAGTPVICFKTGGLKDTVEEFDGKKGNGFTFEAYTYFDFVWAVKRAMETYFDPVKYEVCRKNASECALDTKVVCWQWWKEFCRLRGRMTSERENINKLLASFGADTEKEDFLDLVVYK